MPLYLSFDIGTTSLKTALTRDDGAVVAVHSAEYTFDSPRPGWAEMDPDTYWRAAVEGSAAVLTASGSLPADVAAIGFSSQGQTFMPVDASGSPLHPAIVWTDQRALEVAERWQREWLSADDYRRISGYSWVPAELTAFKIGWLAEHAPSAHRAARFLCIPDYLLFRLTGEYATDRVIAQYSGLYDIRQQRWSETVLAAAGITSDQLPRLLEPGTPAGRLGSEPANELGLPAGVPVCVGANDQIAGAVGAGNVTPGVVSETTGTALAVVATCQEMAEDAMVTGPHAVSGRYYAMQFANTSAVVLKWFRDLCGCCEDYDSFLARVEKVPPGCGGLNVLPHFSGTADDPGARGGIFGLTLDSSREQIARAIMEACCCELVECLEPLRHHTEIGTVRSLGGAARSDLWLQMKADMLGAPVERPVCSEAAAMGAAMMAAAGTGGFGSIEEASMAWYRPEKVFEPDAARAAVYADVYSRYIMLCRRVYGR